MKKNRILTFLIVAVLSSILLSGCNIFNDIFKASSSQIRDEMLEYMSIKYGKNFIGLSLERSGIDRSSDKLICYAEGEDRYKDFTYVYRDVNEDIVTYSDTYFNIVIRDEVEKGIENIMNQLGYEAKAFSGTLTRIYDQKYDSSKTLFDLMSDNTQPGLLVEIALTGSFNTLSEEDSQKLFNALSDAKFRGAFSLYYFSKPIFDSITDENENRFLSPVDENVINSYARIL